MFGENIIGKKKVVCRHFHEKVITKVEILGKFSLKVSQIKNVLEF